MSAPVVVVGSYNQDHVWRVPRFPGAGETLRGERFTTGAGGKGYNQAVAAARQGADTIFIGARGNDALGELAAANAARAGIHCRWQVLDAHATGTAAVIVDPAGQNRIVVALGANERLDAAFVRAQAAALQRAGVVLAQLETSLDAVDAALAAAGAEAVRILNPAPVDPALGAALLRRCDVVTPNETELAQLLELLAGIRLQPEAVAALPDAELAALCGRLPVATVVVTLGRHGCFVAHATGGGRRHDAAARYRLAAETVQVVDTTGAGDAFNGALAAALARWPDAAFAACARHANRVAALSTERHGAAAAMPDAAAVAARFGAAPPPG